MNQSKPYTRQQRLKGKFVIEKVFIVPQKPKNKLHAILQRLKLSRQKNIPLTKYFQVQNKVMGWVVGIENARPFTYVLAHKITKEMNYQDTTVKMVTKFGDKLIAY